MRDLTGKTFDRLKVLKLDESSLGQGSRIKWICQCECGNIVSVFANNLIKGNTRSCGCLLDEARMTHGLTRTKHGKRLSGIHGAMIRRCYAPSM